MRFTATEAQTLRTKPGRAPVRSRRPGSSVLVDAAELGRSGQVPCGSSSVNRASPIRRSSASWRWGKPVKDEPADRVHVPWRGIHHGVPPGRGESGVGGAPVRDRELSRPGRAPPHRRVRSGRPQLTFNDAYSPHSDSCGKLPFVRLVTATPVTLTCHTDIRRIVDDTRCDARALAGHSDRAAVIGLPWVTPNGRRRPFRKRGRRRLRKGRSGRYRVGLVRAVVAQLLDVAVGSALVADARRSCPSLGILN